MNDEDKLRLRVNQPYIAKNVDLSDIIDDLISNGIIDDDFYHRLNNKSINQTPKDAMTNLLFQLPKKGPEAYLIFYTSLGEQYVHVQKKLNETDIETARRKFNLAKEKKDDQMREDVQNLLRTTHSLLQTINSGFGMMNEPDTDDAPVESSTAGSQNNASSRELQPCPTTDSTQDFSALNISVDIDTTDYTSEEPRSPTLLFFFDDEVMKDNVLTKINELSECSRHLDMILCSVTDYLHFLQNSYEDRKQQTMFFADAVKAICGEVQCKLHELDTESQVIVSQAEKIIMWTGDEMFENQQQVMDLIGKIDKTQMDVLRAVKLVKPIVFEAQRKKEKPSRSASCVIS